MSRELGPVITTADIEDAVKVTLQRWLHTMLAHVERESRGRWDLGQIQRPKSWQLVTDYTAHSADRRLPCIAVETGPSERSYAGDGQINQETGLNVFVITKGTDRDKTRETLGGLVAAVLMVLEKHGDLDGFAVGTVIGEIVPDAVPAEKAKTAAGARIAIAVLVDGVGSRWGGPSEPVPPPPTPLPPASPEDPVRLTTNVAVERLP